MSANSLILRKYETFFLNWFLVFLLYQMYIGNSDAEVQVVRAQISQEAIVQLSVGNSSSLIYVKHPSNDILYFLQWSNNKWEISQPSETIYKNRTKNAYIKNNIFFFTITDSRKEDAGLYKCDDINCKQMLVILGKPTKPVLISDDIFVANRNTSFNCSTSSTSLPPNHGLHMNFVWKYNDEILHHTENIITMMINKRSHGGNITCQCYEDVKLKSETSNTITLDVQYSPKKITIEPQKNVIIEENKNLSVVCNVECRPDCNVTWRKRNTSTPKVEGKNLSFVHVTRFDAGVYTCTAGNIHGTSSEDFSLDVHYQPSIHSYMIGDQQVSISSMMENSALNISLTIDSNPKPHIQMKKDGETFNYEGRMTVTSEGEKSIGNTILQHAYKVTFSLVETMCKDMGNYSVIVSNNYGQASQDFQVKLLCYPKLDKDRYFKSMFAPRLADTVNVKIWLVSFPPPTVQNIYHNGVQLPSNHFLMDIKSSDEKYETEISLTKKNFTTSDIGEYNVELKNNISAERSFNISFKFVEKGPPSVPLNLKVVDIGSHAVELQWVSAFNGGEKQTFSVYYRHFFGNWTHFNKTYNDVGEGSVISAKITGLRDLTSYLFKVISKNVINESGYSEVRSAKTKGITSVPNDAPISGETGIYIGIGLGLVILLLIIMIVVVIMAKRRRKTIQKDKFFNSLKEGLPMMSDANENDAYSKLNHEYEEIKITSKASSSAPPKPPRTYEEDEAIKASSPIWKPAERKTPKVNENTEHLHDARRALKPVEKKPAL